MRLSSKGKSKLRKRLTGNLLTKKILRIEQIKKDKINKRLNYETFA